MKIYILKIIHLLIILFLIIGCEDDTVTEEIPAYNLSEILISQDWYIQSATGEIGDVQIDLFTIEDIVPPCTLDNLFFFNEDYLVTMDDHIILCEEGEQSALDISGVWSVENDLLTIQNDGDMYLLTVVNLTPTSMDLMFNYFYADFDVEIPAKIVLVAN